MSDTVGSSGPTGAATSSGALERGRSLVFAAFDEARASGREDWNQMTTAVLKNRLLNSTNREFDERVFGVSSMVDFVRLFPADFEVDTRGTHPLVRLTRPETLPSPTTEDGSSTKTGATYKIRPDLWRAAVDYRSGSTYVWDETAGVAHIADPGDPRPVVPTVTDTEVGEWRQDFAEAVRSEPGSERVVERLNEWLQHGYGTSFLPAGLRGRWNEFARGKVEARLRDFFEDHNLTAPDDLLIDYVEQPSRSLQAGRRSDVPRLRALVQRCVAVMTEQELTELRISPAVLLRAIRGWS
ncbi:MAG: OST-HTH/LOTUS domain-containing protein [Pseudonocardiaceae bacterium]